MQNTAQAEKLNGLKSDFLGDVFSLKLEDYPRVARLRDAVLNAQPGIAHERSKLLVDYFDEHGFDLEHKFLRQARSLEHILKNIDPTIFPEELIVGSATEHRLGCMMYPEFQGNMIWPEIVKLPYRKRNPVNVSDEAIEDYSFRIFPYFKDRNIMEWTKQHYGYTDSIQLMERMIFYLIALPNGVSHMLPNYPVAMQLGFNRIKEMAGKKLAGITGSDVEARSKRELYEAMQVSADGVMEFARNHSRKCAELAASETDPVHMAELEELSRITARCPAEPAETFWEGLQSVWLTHLAVMMENSDLAVNFGRMDQYLMPLYQRDIDSGKLTPERALELIMCFYIKTNDHTPFLPSGGEALFSGSGTNQSITLSGLDPDGKDATNDLSYLMIKAMDLLRMREPNVDARFHERSPREWYQKVLEVVRSTGAAPALYNDEAIVPAMIAKGATLEDARDYGVIGCVETTVQGKAYGMTGAILLNIAAAMELSFNNGVYNLSKLQIGPQTGFLKDFTSYDEFWNAFVAQIKNLTDMSVEAEKLFDRSHEDLHPIPLLSSITDGPMENGTDLTSGGATYNSSGVWVVGLADVVDSLAALKKLVFEEKRVSPQEMQDALRADFRGYENVHAMCVNRAPKYGNDDPEADEIAVKLVNEIDGLFGQHENYRGGPYHVGYWSVTVHSGYGKITGALPNGRKRKQSLASGATPVSGAARQGPTAALSSTAKLPPGPLANCIANNHKIPASIMNQPGKMDIVEQLVKGYFKKGGMQVQFVIADKEMLVEAMEDSEKAKDLLVRVSGYTAYFGDLNKSMQREIIERTEDQI